MRVILCLCSTIILGTILGLVVTLKCEEQTGNLFSQPTSASEPILPIEIRPKDVVWEMLEQVNHERVLTDLRQLTGEEPICTENGCYTITGRETGSEGLQWAKDYVYETLVSLRYAVEIMGWSRDGYTDQNIIARKRGLVYPDEEIYFIAHLDGYLDYNPAADDDASGAVSLLELARILSKSPLSRTVVIFFSTGEEHGSLGSRSYIEDYPDRLDAIKYLVSVDMIGYDSDSDGKMEFWTGDQQLDFVSMLTDIITMYKLGLIPDIVTDCY
jgi:hypothetical protein